MRPGGREPAKATVHPGLERREDTDLCSSSCPFRGGLLQGPWLPACVLPCGGGGARVTQVRVAEAGGREPAGARGSEGNGMWARHGSGRGLGAWVGIKNMGGAGSGRGVGVGAARVGTEDPGGAPGQRPARQSLDRPRQAGLPIPPWGSLRLVQGSSESWSPARCLWGLPSLDSRSLFLPTPKLCQESG